MIFLPPSLLILLLVAQLVVCSAAQPINDFYEDTILSKNTGPTPRHSSIIYVSPTSSKLYIFGGSSNVSRHLQNDSWMFDFSRAEWSHLSPSFIPSPLCYAPSSSSSSSFSSNNCDSPSSSDSFLWILAEDEESRLFKFFPENRTIEDTENPINMSLVGGACAAFEEAFYHFGGKSLEDEGGMFSAELLKFNGSWAQVQTTGPVPPPRSGATLTTVGDFLVLYGGSNDDGVLSDLWHFYLQNNSWVKIYDDFGPRADHSSVLVCYNESIIFYGGRDNEDRFVTSNRMYFTSSRVWANFSGIPLVHHSAAFSRGRMIVFGGVQNDFDLTNNLTGYVPELLCSPLDCQTCLKTPACGWCTSRQCMAGFSNQPYPNLCSQDDTFSNSTCASPISHIWLIITGILTGFLFAGIVILIKLSFFSPREYDEINSTNGD